MHLRSLAAVVAATTLAACASESAGPADAPALAKTTATGQGISPILDSINQVLTARGVVVNIAKAEFVLANKPGFDAAGQVVFANNRAKRLGSRWVAGDPRRPSNGGELSFLNLTPFMFANGDPTPFDGSNAVNSSFATWDNQTCSTLGLVQTGWDGTFNPSGIIPSNFLGLGALPVDPLRASINTIGFLDPFFFEVVLGPGSSQNVLGVTFTFNFINPADGSATDINGDGYLDTALKEIWYNNAFTWATSGLDEDGIDVESVTLHENGHALELGHFGKIFGTLGNLRLHVAPRAVMNAAILGTLRSPLGTDNAAFCGVWANWP